MKFDEIIIEFVHSLCEKCGVVMTPLMRLVSLLGEKCWLPLLFSAFLFFRKKTRWMAATAIASVFIGFIIADIVLKPFIGRERPYIASEIFNEYWILAGGYADTGFSMPSGHTVGLTAFFAAIYLTCKKADRNAVKNVAVIAIILMILSRCYFMHHYFTDCIVGVFVGLISACIGRLIVKTIYDFCKKNQNYSLFSFILNFDLLDKF